MRPGLRPATLLAFAVVLLFVALAIILLVLHRETKTRRKRQDAAADPNLPSE